MGRFFFFNGTAATEICTLSLHDALPISAPPDGRRGQRAVPAEHGRGAGAGAAGPVVRPGPGAADRKSTRLNSSHANTSYAVFCLKKKNSSFTSFPLGPASLPPHPSFRRP